MLSYPQQIELLNLKERIINNLTLRKRLIDLHGQSKGWQEFAQELSAEYTIVRHLKDMAICELSYTTRDFTALRAEVYNEEKEDMIRHAKRKPVIIINSPNAIVEITTVSRKPVTIVSARKATQVTVVANKKQTRTLYNRAAGIEKVPADFLPVCAPCGHTRRDRLPFVARRRRSGAQGQVPHG